MKITTYAIVIAARVAAAILLRVYLPKNQEITYLASSGVQRSIIRVNLAAFWLMITIAIGVAAAYALRR
jgi:hypothetical protein